MKSKKILLSFLFAFLTLALFTAAFAKDVPFQSQWVTVPASIDGMNTEWGNAAIMKQKKVKVECAFMNDQENLFILFVFKDPKYLSSINWTGLTVWLCPQGKKDKDLGINFIKKQISADDYIAILEKQVGQTMPEDKKNQVRKNKSYWLFDQALINKKAAGYSKDAEKPKYKGALFRNNVLDKSVLYEFAISFSKLAEIAPEIGAEPGKSLNLNFEWGGATKEYKKALASGMGRQQTKARDQNASTGSFTSERGSGGGLGDMDPERATSSQTRLRRQLQRVKQYDFWVELNLAQKK